MSTSTVTNGSSFLEKDVLTLESVELSEEELVFQIVKYFSPKNPKSWQKKVLDIAEKNLLRIAKFMQLKKFGTALEKLNRLTFFLMSMMGNYANISAVVSGIAISAVSATEPVEVFFNNSTTPTITKYRFNTEYFLHNPFLNFAISAFANLVIGWVLWVLWVALPKYEKLISTIALVLLIIFYDLSMTIGGYQFLDGPGLGGLFCVVFLIPIFFCFVINVYNTVVVGTVILSFVVLFVLDIVFWEYVQSAYEDFYFNRMRKNAALTWIFILVGYLEFFQMGQVVYFTVWRFNFSKSLRSHLSKEVRMQRKKLKKVEIIEDDIDMIIAEKEAEIKFVENKIPILRINKKIFEIDFSDLKVVDKIGSGASCTVYKCEFKGVVVALKSFMMSQFAKQRRIDLFEKEVEILASLHHPHVLSFLGATISKNRVGIVLEYAALGDIRKFLSSWNEANNNSNKSGGGVDAADGGGEGGNEKYPVDQKIRMLSEISSALNYVHHKGVIHRDLKPENVVVMARHESKVMDFGVSRYIDSITETKTSHVGTREYMAPEVVIDGKYSEMCDVYSFGILLYAFITEQFRPYRRTLEEAAKSTSVGGSGADGKSIELRVAMDPTFRPMILKKEFEECEHLVGLMTRCWDSDQAKRPSFENIFKSLQEHRTAEPLNSASYSNYSTQSREKTTGKRLSATVRKDRENQFRIAFEGYSDSTLSKKLVLVILEDRMVQTFTHGVGENRILMYDDIEKFSCADSSSLENHVLFKMLLSQDEGGKSSVEWVMEKAVSKSFEKSFIKQIEIFSK